MKNFSNRKKIFLPIVITATFFSLSACSQNNEEITYKKNSNKIKLSNYTINQINLEESKQNIINDNINEIKKLPKHYLGKIKSSFDLLNSSNLDIDYEELMTKNIYPKEQEMMYSGNYWDRAPKINRVIVVKRNNSNYEKEYAVTLPKDFDFQSLINEPVYLYEVPRSNLFIKDFRDVDNSYGDIKPEDESLKFQNIICFKDMCAIEYNMYQ